MKAQAYILQIIIGLMGLSFNSLSYAQSVSSSAESTRYIVQVSDLVYTAIAESVFSPQAEFTIPFASSILNPFLKNKEVVDKIKAVSLSRIYNNIAPEYKDMISSMGANSQAFALGNSFTANPQVKLLPHLQILIVDSASFDKEAVSQFSGIELVQKDKYFYLYGDATNRKQNWMLDNTKLSQLLEVFANSNKNLSVNKKKTVSEIEKKYGNFWALEAIQARQAWSTYNNLGSNVRVMVADTGVDTNHPDLSEAFEKGKSFVIGTKSFADVEGHGTHVAGTVLGKSYGVAPKAKLLVGKICGNVNGGVSCSSSAILQALNWAIEEKVDVINLSLGSDIEKNKMFKPVYQKVVKSGSLVVAAAGNAGRYIKNKISYPAGYQEVISVGSVKAVEDHFEKSHFSQYSSRLDIVAPGEKIISTVPLSSFKEVLTLHVKNDKGEEKAIPMLSTLVMNSTKSSIAKSELVFSTAPYINGKFVLFSLDSSMTSPKIVLNKLQSLDRRGAAAVFFVGSFKLKQWVTNILAKEHFSFIYYLVPEQIGNKLHKIITNPQVTMSFSLQVKTNIKYYKMSGTSMASPHVAGILALAKSKKSGLDFKEARLLLKTSAKSVSSITNGVGAGLAQTSDLLSLMQ